ncbi:hypothetical protein RIF29_30585 [Crotalaria pallida]|uniref:Ribosome-recycling factor, chloroplastic n=1 Tax=Crotalaria pallida TaxID=3830 RepID=A0AAN9HUR6_CROPI
MVHLFPLRSVYRIRRTEFHVLGLLHRKPCNNNIKSNELVGTTYHAPEPRTVNNVTLTWISTSDLCKTLSLLPLFPAFHFFNSVASYGNQEIKGKKHMVMTDECDHRLKPSKSKNSNSRCERGRRLMSAYVRRAFSCRSFFLLRSSALHGYNSSLITRTPINNSMFESNWVFNVPASNFIVESRRAFAKGRKSKDEAGMSTIEVPPDVLPNIKANAVSLMESAIGALSGELSKLRTGRASPGMLDHIIVEISGVKMHMNRVAVVSVIDQKTLSVNPYDPQTLKQLEDAIVSSPLGLNPKVDGDRLIAVIPPLTKEHIQAMSKLVTKACEESRLSIRRARQKAMDAIKKLYSNLPKDDIKRFEKEVDDLTKKFIKNAEDVCKAKEKEISQGS